ncbi:MAG: hypothetical protein ACM32O_02950 [Clostridia bacterium]
MAQFLNMEDLLGSMVGRTIQVYKGGPESRIGKCVAVKGSSHLVVDTGEDGILYYNLEHIKTVCEDLNDPLPVMNRSEDFYDRYLEAETMNDVLQSLKYSVVRIDRGGPESRVGRILGVGKNYFVMQTKEEGVIYYNTRHLKSISEYESNDFQKVSYPEYIEGEDIAELLGKLQHKWVKINRGGPEAVEGVLTSSDGERLTVVSNKVVYHVSISHMRNLNFVEKTYEQFQDANNQNQQNQNNNQQQENQSSNQQKAVQQRSSQRARTRTSYSRGYSSRRKSSTMRVAKRSAAKKRG